MGESELQSSCVCGSGPLFVVSCHKQVEHYRSPVYERVKRGDLSLLMVPTQPVVVCGDVMIEFFNKPNKMLAKVHAALPFVADRISEEGNVIDSVRPFVSTLSFELSDR